MMAPLPDEARCHAALKSMARWRCSRAAVSHGLCAQHFHFGCRYPSRWAGDNEPVRPYYAFWGSRGVWVGQEKNLAMLDYIVKAEDGELVVV